VGGVKSAAHLDWPFLDDAHRALGAEVAGWLAGQRPAPEAADTPAADAACRAWVQRLGSAGFLRYAVPKAWGGALESLDSRALCVLRESLAAHDGLADFAFAMQGLGSGALTLGGSDALRKEWLPRVASGAAIAAFALSEPDAGSDVAALSTRAVRTGDGWRLDGTKTWISNGGIADSYCVFARTDAAASGSKGISAFLVPATAKGLRVGERIDVISPHPLATLHFDGCLVPDANRLGDEGAGFKLAMRTLDIFRVSVAAAALGFARRALAETLAFAGGRGMFGATLADQPLAQAILGDMATELDSAALLTYRAAWTRDVRPSERHTGVAAMAKLSATELAQRIIDRAVQLHGARGVQRGAIVERLYRDIRALRIYEGASEVQRLLIGRETVRTAAEPDAR
jgi:acyl-CoA dehydrogenase